jgi:hypothetical protein
VLGPLLFVLHTNNLSKSIDQNLMQYAVLVQEENLRSPAITVSKKQIKVQTERSKTKCRQDKYSSSIIRLRPLGLFLPPGNHLPILFVVFQYYLWYSILIPSLGSCHHGMVRPLGWEWGSRLPDMEVSCEYIE